jgi:two-component system, OmpR family, response regulator MprA
MPKCILIADDHEHTRKLIRSFLESLDGCVCGEAVDGLDALQKAASLNPDLIVLDFQMPRMNGLEAARVLNQMLPAVPIILFTMHKDVLRAADMTALGITVVMSKMDGLDLLGSHALRLLA